MRLLFVVPYFYPAWPYGGAMRSAYELARALAARGHRVRVLSTDSGGETRLPKVPKNENEPVSVDGIEVYYYRNASNSLAFRQRLFWPPGYFRNVGRHVGECDVLHIHELRSTLAPSAFKAARHAEVPFVVSPHGGLRHLGRGAAKRVFDALYGHAIVARASMVVAVSPLEGRQAEEFGVDPMRVRVLPNAVAPEEYTPLPEPAAFRKRWNIGAEKVLLFLGRLHRLKGADLLIQAFGRLANAHPEVHLAIAGPDDGAEADLRNLVRSIGMGRRVTFIGFIDRAQKLEALAGSDALVIPSRSEVFAIAAVEAMLCGLPIVLSSVCGLSPRPGGELGVRQFQSESVDDLARVLTDFLKAPRRPDIEACRAFVAREFSPGAVAAKAETLYAEARRSFNPEALS
jgi:glycosyltransferase involved in cell wall biosynthesis